uniref:Nuf2 domain-containing protein n=1 Tax=Steinernema glaseri TaxID=37863 RepID=A0A1I7ZVI4_9BILA
MVYHNIANLEVGMLTKYLNAQFPQLNVSHTDITHPKGDQIYEIYATLLKSILNLPDRAFNEIPLELACPLFDPDTHGNTVPKFLLLFHLNNCLQDITNKELAVSPQDFFCPCPDRTRAILSSLVVFHRFLGGIRPHMDYITELQKKRLVDFEEMQARVMRAESENIPAQIDAEKQKLDELTEAYQEIENESKDLCVNIEVEKQKCTALEAEKEERLTKLKTLKASVESLQIKLETLKEDLVSSPEKILADVNRARAQREDVSNSLTHLRNAGYETECRLKSFATGQHRIKLLETECVQLRERVSALQPKSVKRDELSRQQRALKQTLEDLEVGLKDRKQRIARENDGVQRDRSRHQRLVADYEERIIDVQNELGSLQERGEKADHELQDLNREYHRIVCEINKVKESHTNRMNQITNLTKKSEEKFLSETQKWNDFLQEKDAAFQGYLGALTVVSDENVSVEPTAMDTD